MRKMILALAVLPLPSLATACDYPQQIVQPVVAYPQQQQFIQPQVAYPQPVQFQKVRVRQQFVQPHAVIQPVVAYPQPIIQPVLSPFGFGRQSLGFGRQPFGFGRQSFSQLTITRSRGR
jgi:hypothetical protein